MKLRSIQTKIALASGLCLVAAATVIIFLAETSLRQTAVKSSVNEATAATRKEVGKLQIELEKAMQIARTLADTFSAIKDPEVGLDISRRQANGILKTILRNNPDFNAVFTVWEPDAFDGLDMGYADTEGHDASGRFAPFWKRDENGDINVVSQLSCKIHSPGGQPGPWYTEPKTTGKDYIADPFNHPVQGKDEVVVAVAVPITLGDQFYGVVGIDMDLKFLQTLVDGVNLYDGAAVMRVISSNGTLAGVTGKENLRGASLKEAYPEDGDADAALVAGGEEVIQVEEGRLEVFLPFTLGTAEKSWSGNILIPQGIILAEVNALLWQQIGIGALLVAAALIVLWFISRGIALPIRKAAGLAQAVQRGDLSARLDIRSDDEIGQLANALNSMADGLADKARMAAAIAQGDLTTEIRLASEQDQFGKALQEMVRSLGSIVGQINVAADQIAAGAGEVSDSGQSLSQGATEQASSMEQISASMNEISSQTKLSAENATQANLLANQARDAAEKGNRRMSSMVDAMAEISRAGQDISKIIKTIDEIAFQTNLLALNAAVEAARAGQHGKGFAVVAEEVRNLAARSAKAARETAQLIEGTVTKTNNGTQIANDTASALEEIVTRIGRVTDLVAEIAAASNEQAQGFSQVNQGLGEIDKVTQQNTANAEESAAAAEELSAQAAELKSMLSRFRLKDSGMRLNAPRKQSAAGPRSAPKAMPAPAPSKSRGGWEDLDQGYEPMIALDDDEFGKY
ncbi:MAG: hypothetical protein A2X84_04950 [Desulfuromonadaceae bacterium GWC2_58_13]|nr:MAG: hypothetical protein A2X84_04950 [Desulfuromonadaceae bacterium GWC2_58_13]